MPVAVEPVVVESIGERALKQAMLRDDKELFLEPWSENDTFLVGQLGAMVERFAVREKVYSVPFTRLARGKSSKVIAVCSLEIMSEARTFFPLVSRVQSDSGGEWSLLASLGANLGRHRAQVANQHSSNGRCERLIGLLKEQSRRILLDSNQPSRMWARALTHATKLRQSQILGEPTVPICFGD